MRIKSAEKVLKISIKRSECVNGRTEIQMVKAVGLKGGWGVGEQEWGREKER